MKLRLSVVALSAALATACTTTDNSRAKLDVRPTLSVRHSAESAASYYQLGRYFHGQNRLALAEEAYQRATALDAGHIDALNALGSLYAERGELERAAASFAQAVALAPDAAYLHSNLGYAYHLQGRPVAAYAELYQALRRDPGYERAWRNLQQLASLRPDPALTATIAARQFDQLPETLPGAQAVALPASPGDSETIRVAVATLPSVPALAAGSSDNAAVGEPAAIPPSPATEAAPVVAQPETSESASAAASPVDFSALHIEVSNGNGIPRFARNFRAQLKADGIPVSRVTNLGSFRLQESVVEYQPGHEPAARALNARLGLAARVVAAIKPRPRSDIRIALGRDATAPAGMAPKDKPPLARL
ncbi:LytR C-terminal domain-containing protein [Dechloromonas sp. XY25]|uniref:LytR C-terminal domain-containing protein n=1 Tax=Dechloromonas hankyongensis TaxID=2908002 RepID=A0ABS9K010_9RHOO|nr:LytR C-terminal domain-containing protein [Dechloromonas hankyongensis]MCG2576456.1 LytR C-terminal domain-containing protein [Dechloromonas hankyongensis]